MTKHIVVFSHGFGVRKDDRGLFTDIAAGLPGVMSILFDYNEADETANTLTVAPLRKQAALLEQVLIRTRDDNPDAVIDLMCHSQGCIVAAMLRPQNIRKVVFLAPPTTLSQERMLKLFGNRPGSKVDLLDKSLFTRRDGSTTIVPKEYWDDLPDIKPIPLYNELANDTQLIIIRAKHDEILGKTRFTDLSPNITLTDLEGDHDFTGTERRALIAAIQKELGV